MHNCPSHSISKLMVRPSGSTKPWNNILKYTLIIFKTSGLIGYPWLNSPANNIESEITKFSFFSLTKNFISINHAIELNFPKNLHVHFVFYVNFLEFAATDAFHHDHIQFFDPSIEIDGKTEYEITAMINFRFSEKIKKI